MRHLLTLVALLMILASSAGAQVLSSAISVPPGQWKLYGIAGRQGNVGNNSSFTQTLYGLGLATGLADKTELDLTYEYGGFSGIPGMELSIGSISLSLKYNLLLEAPFSFAVGANYSYLYQRDNFAGSPTGANYGLKVIISKVYSKFIPYACLNRSCSSLAGESYSTEATLGGIWMINNRFAVMAENTWQMFPAGYTGNMFSFSGAYSL
jgi:hypothetical protein